MKVNHDCLCGAECCVGGCGSVPDESIVFEIETPAQNTQPQLSGFADVWAGFNLFADIVGSL